MPWKAGKSKEALRVLYVFDELKSVVSNIAAAPWVEVTEPLKVQRCAAKDVDANLTKYTFVTDGGNISIVSRLGRSEILDRTKRSGDL